MPLAPHFWKHFNGDVTGVGKSPLRKRFSKFRQSRIKRIEQHMEQHKLKEFNKVKQWDVKN